MSIASELAEHIAKIGVLVIEAEQEELEAVVANLKQAQRHLRKARAAVKQPDPPRNINTPDLTLVEQPHHPVKARRAAHRGF